MESGIINSKADLVTAKQHEQVRQGEHENEWARPTLLGFNPGTTQTGGEADAAVMAQKLFVMRQQRRTYFDMSLFGEPAWDMMLDLFIAQAHGQPISVSSLCLAAQIPQTTALRYIERLVAEGIFERQKDSSDGRRVFVHLSAAASRSLTSLLSVEPKAWFRPAK